MATVLNIRRVIAQPADGRSFIVSVSPPMPTVDYSVRPVPVDVDAVPVFEFPEADRQETQFRVVTSALLEDGDVIQFALVHP